MLWSALRSGDIRNAIIILALSLPAVILCLSVHEASHGLAAYAMGDKTAQQAGRLTLSPLAHIDPYGFFALLLFGFGWARPVPVNLSNFKNRRAGMAITAFAGPLSNMILGFLFFCLYFLAALFIGGNLGQSIAMFCYIVANMSIGLGVFNLIPIHPLDGSRVVDAFLPFSWSQKIQRYQPYIIIIFVAALWFGWINIPMAWAQDGIAHLAQRFLGLFFQ